MGKIVISIIPTIRTFSYIFVPIRNSRFSSDSHFFFLHQACAEQRLGSRVCNPVSASVLQGAVQSPDVTCGPKANLDLCLQCIPMHGSAAGTATPKQPRNVKVHKFFNHSFACRLSSCGSGSPLIRTFSYFFVPFHVRMGDKPCQRTPPPPHPALRQPVHRCGLVLHFCLVPPKRDTAVFIAALRVPDHPRQSGGSFVERMKSISGPNGKRDCAIQIRE